MRCMGNQQTAPAYIRETPDAEKITFLLSSTEASV